MDEILGKPITPLLGLILGIMGIPPNKPTLAMHNFLRKLREKELLIKSLK